MKLQNIIKYRKSLSALTLALALGSTPVLAQEPQLSFYPAGNWSVSEGEICKASSAFNNGFVMEVGGGGEGLNSLSIDFRQGVFESQKSYPVSLATPGMGPINATGTAANGQVLNINVRGQASLLAAMRNTAALDVGVENNRFRFYLVGFSAVAGQMENCMAGKGYSPISATPPPVVSAPVSEPQENILARISSPAEKAAIQYEAEETSTENIVVSTQQGYTRMSERLQQEMDGAYSSEDQTAPAPAPAPAPPPSTETEEVFVPASSVEAAPPAPEQKSYVFTSQADQSTKAETVAGPAEIPAEPPVTLAPPAEEDLPVEEFLPQEPQIIQTVKGEDKSGLEYLGIEEDSKVKVVDREKYEVEADFTKVRDLEAENAALQAELTAALEESRTEQTMISSENWDLERATMRYNEAERQIQVLGQKLQRERTACEMEKKELETMLFDPQVTSQQQQAKLADLESQLAKAQEELDLQRMRYDERIKLLEEQLKTQ